MIHSIKQLKFEYSKITNNIFIGTNKCCQIHFNKSLIKKGIFADISLEKELNDSPQGVKLFLWIPTIDHKAPPFHLLKLGVDVLDHIVKENLKVYVHCRSGHTRAPTLVAAYFIKKGYSIKEAISIIKKKRPKINIHPDQMKALKKYQIFIRKLS